MRSQPTTAACVHIYIFANYYIIIIIILCQQNVKGKRVKSFCRKTSWHGFDYKLSRSL